MLGNFSIKTLLNAVSFEPLLINNPHTWNPFLTILSFRAHVAISLRKCLKVFNPIRVSGFSSWPSPVVKRLGGGAVAGGGGITHMAL